MIRLHLLILVRFENTALGQHPVPFPGGTDSPVGRVGSTSELTCAVGDHSSVRSRALALGWHSERKNRNTQGSICRNGHTCRQRVSSILEFLLQIKGCSHPP